MGNLQVSYISKMF